MDGYRRWAASSQAAWVMAMGFFLIAALNLVAGGWKLAAFTAVVGVVMLVRARSRLKRERGR